MWIVFFLRHARVLTAMDVTIKQVPSPHIRQKYKMMPRIRLASLIEMPEDSFIGLIKKIESSDLFRKLTAPVDRRDRVIRCAWLRGAGFADGFFQLKEELSHDTTGSDIETLLEGKQELLTIIRSLGVRQFEELFLANEACLSAREISDRCGLSEENVGRINDLVSEVAVHGEFASTGVVSAATGIHFYRVATISDNGRGELAASFTSPRFLAGKYVVDRAALEKLKARDYFTDEEIRSLDQLLKEIELVNSRRSTLYRILQCLLEKQKQFLVSGKKEDLMPCTQKEMARETGIDESLICRALQHRSVQLPDGSEVPLQHLFVNRKTITKRLIKDIIASHAGDRLTDRRIMAELKARFGIAISRRTVNAYKKLT